MLTTVSGTVGGQLRQVSLHLEVSYVFRLFSPPPITSQHSTSPPDHREQDKRALPEDLQNSKFPRSPGNQYHVPDNSVPCSPY